MKKKALYIVLTLCMAFVLVACGSNASDSGKEEDTGKDQKEAAADNKIYAEDLFAIEETAYESDGYGTTNIEAKVRNISNKQFSDVMINTVTLDSNEDILSKEFFGENEVNLEPDQAIWLLYQDDYCRTSMTIDDLASHVTILELTSVSVSEKGVEEWNDYDFKEPIKIKIADLQEKTE